MFTTVSKPLASINLQFLFDKKSSVTLRMYRKVGCVNRRISVFIWTFSNFPFSFCHGSPYFSERWPLCQVKAILLTVAGKISREGLPIRFTIQDTERKLLLTSTSSADRILWLRKLEEARKHCLLTERAVLQRQRSSSEMFFYLYLISASVHFHQNLLVQISV